MSSAGWNRYVLVYHITVSKYLYDNAKNMLCSLLCSLMGELGKNGKEWKASVPFLSVLNEILQLLNQYLEEPSICA